MGGELDGVMNLWLPNGTGLVYQLNAIAFYDPADPPDDRHLLRDLQGMRLPPIPDLVSDMPYPDWAMRVDRLIDLMRTTASWDRLVKPWFDVWLPESAVERYVGEVIPTLTPDDVGPGGFVLLFPQRRSNLTRPFVPMPDAPQDEWSTSSTSSPHRCCRGRIAASRTGCCGATGGSTTWRGPSAARAMRSARSASTTPTGWSTTARPGRSWCGARSSSTRTTSFTPGPGIF